MIEINLFGKKIKPRLIFFAASSLVAFFVDWAVIEIAYICLSRTSLNSAVAMIISQSAARVVSSVVNFYMNYIFVFENKGNLLYSALMYSANVLVILALQFVIMYILDSVLGLSHIYTPAIVQTSTFPVNYVIQKLVVYNKKEHREK